MEDNTRVEQKNWILNLIQDYDAKTFYEKWMKYNKESILFLLTGNMLGTDKLSKKTNKICWWQKGGYVCMFNDLYKEMRNKKQNIILFIDNCI